MRSPRFLLLALLATALAAAPSPPALQSAAQSSAAVHLSPQAAAALAERRVPAVYPAKARANGIQGAVVLSVLISELGEVKQATVSSGNPDLAQAALESIKQWKYKPYIVDGKPTPVQTEVAFGFQLKAPPARPTPPPPPGSFKDGKYENEFFGISYPLSMEWVRETTLLRKQVASDENEPRSSQVLLAALHVPAGSEDLVADSSFVLTATAFSPPAQGDAKDYLSALATWLSKEQRSKQQGEIARMEFAGLAAYRANFKPSKGSARYESVICAMAKGYVLEWNFLTLSESALEDAVSTVSAVAKLESAPVDTTAEQDLRKSEPALPARVSLEKGITTGLVIKKVEPKYPAGARSAHIQGVVALHAVIDKAGNIIDLEAVTGPVELLPSAVNAVRQWKYRPYLLKGEPIELETTIEIKYTLGG